jgi:hypothetical protein
MKHHPAGLPSWADDTLGGRFAADQQDAATEDAAVASAAPPHSPSVIASAA